MAAGFPLYIDMTGRKIVVIGGGAVARRKVRTLMQFDAQICVISSELDDELVNLEEEGRIICQRRQFLPESMAELNHAFMVICATSDRQLNEAVAVYCREQQIWVDCADSAELSSCLFPSVVKRDDIVIGISTSGGVPALAKHLRQRIEQTVPEWYGILARQMRAARDRLKQSDMPMQAKRDYLRHMIEEAERSQSSAIEEEME